MTRHLDSCIGEVGTANVSGRPPRILIPRDPRAERPAEDAAPFRYDALLVLIVLAIAAPPALLLGYVVRPSALAIRGLAVPLVLVPAVAVYRVDHVIRHRRRRT
jgi:hypothetical protein